MIDMQIIRSDHSLQAAGSCLNDLLWPYQEQPILLLLSGGSAFSLLSYVDTASLLDHVTISLIDERSSVDPGASNWLKLQATGFYHAAIKANARTIEPLTHSTSDDQAAVIWERNLQQWFLDHPSGVCIATLGIGHDGHIAGIFPGDWGDKLSGPAWTAAYELPEHINPYTKRLTVTNTFLLRQVDHAVVYAVGEEKAAVITALLNKTSALETLPARILYLMKDVQFFTDEMPL